MYKRLTISLILMGLAVFSIAAGATAWFSDSGSASVTITAGDADLVFAADADCDGTPEGPYVDNAPSPVNVSDVAPGDSATGCVIVSNVGTVALDVHVKHLNVSGQLQNTLQVSYVGTSTCGPALANVAGYTTGRGCPLASLAPNGTQKVSATVSFPDNGNQNHLQNESLGMTVEVTGYSS